MKAFEYLISVQSGWFSLIGNRKYVFVYLYQYFPFEISEVPVGL